MIKEIRVDNQLNGIGIDSKRPFITWLSDKDYDGFRLIISEDKKKIEKNIGDFLDTGDIITQDNFYLLDKPLTSRTTYYIKVKALTKEEKYSEIYSFETGNFGQFFGIWIEDEATNFDDYEFYQDIPTPIFYKKFEITKEMISKARLYITGLGYYETKINGKLITDTILNPGISTYDKQTFYDTYDIKDYLKVGENIIEVELGNGMYNVSEIHLFGKYDIRKKFQTGHNKMICDIEIKYDSGAINYVWSDRTWKCKESNRIKNDIYLGEHVDFSKNTFHESGVIEANGPKNLVATYFPKMRRSRTLNNCEIKKINSYYILDFKQNFNGHLCLSIQGKPGSLVHLVYGESLNNEGHVDTLSTIPGGSMAYYGPDKSKKLCQQDYITLSGNKDIFENKFTMHSYRYVEIICNEEIEIFDAIGYLTNTDLSEIGSITTSNNNINTLYNVAIWTKLSNIYSIHADTARERLGYGGDIVCNSKSVNYIFNSHHFHEKIISDFRVEQDPNNGFTETAPFAGIKTKGLGGTTGPIEWQFVFAYLMKIIYTFYGNKRVIEDNYPYFKKQISFLDSLSKEYIMSKGIGDWYALNRTDYLQHTLSDHRFTSIIFLYLHYQYAYYFASILNIDADIELYHNKMINLKSFINEKFRNTDGSYHDGSQTSYAYAIYSGIDTSTQILDKFEKKIKQDGTLTSGIFGMMMSYEVLNKHNRNHIILDYLLKEDNPSFLYCIQHGATTIWENFDVRDGCEGSQNHSMFTSYTQWFYEALGGITLNNEAVGFNKIDLHPYFSKQLNSMSCELNTIKGKISNKWIRRGNKILWDITIPAGIIANNLVHQQLLKAGNYHFEIIEE